MILVRITQRSIPLLIPPLRLRASLILSALQCADYDVSLWFTTDATLRRLNKQYRNIDKPTDVLAFRFQDKVVPGVPPPPVHGVVKDLGDVVISVRQVQLQAKREGSSLDDRLLALMTHGICHLAGYDHQNEEDARIMLQREEAILAAVRRALE